LKSMTQSRWKGMTAKKSNHN